MDRFGWIEFTSSENKAKAMEMHNTIVEELGAVPITVIDVAEKHRCAVRWSEVGYISPPLRGVCTVQSTALPLRCSRSVIA